MKPGIQTVKIAEKVAISIYGKGETGKTTLSILLLKWIIDNTDLIPLIVEASCDKFQSHNTGN